MRKEIIAPCNVQSVGRNCRREPGFALAAEKKQPEEIKKRTSQSTWLM